MNEIVRQISIDLITRGRYQPRSVFSARGLRGLADSILSQGVVQPIVLRPLADGRFEIVAGERRWRASQLAGLPSIPAVIRDVPDAVALEVALIENIQREDLRPIEEARALHRLVDEFDLTHEKVADRIGWQRPRVTQSLRLLHLIKEVQLMVDGIDDEDKPQLERSHAEVLAGLEPAQQLAGARLAVDRGWTVRDLENYCRNHYGKRRADNKKSAPCDPDVRRLEESLSERFGAPVRIKHSMKEGGGDLVFHYHSLEELDGILEKLRRKN